MTISVLVPTYRRCHDLYRCLEAMKQQSRPADEVVVIIRNSDTETQDFLKAYSHELLPLTFTIVSVAGVVAAMNAGLEVAIGDIIAIVDDDAAPHPEWLKIMEMHFLADEKTGGVGGRDIITHMSGESEDVGKLKWWGRVSGNHHIGIGPVRDVDVLKGVNSAYRQAALKKLGFDTRMRGAGAQVHWELSLGLTLKRAGWKLIYDPSIIVYHFPAQRFDEDKRVSFSYIAMVDIVHNETLSMLEHLSLLQKSFFLAWVFMVGGTFAPGFLQVPRLILRRDRKVFFKLLANIVGRVAGIQSFLSGKNMTTDEKFALCDRKNQ